MGGKFYVDVTGNGALPMISMRWRIKA